MRLSDFSFAAKLRGVMVLVAIALAASAILNLYSLHETMMDDRKITLRYVVDQSTSIVQDYAERAKSGEMSEADAKAAALKTLASQRFDNNNYVFVTERDGTMAMHPLVPDLVGKSAASVKDPTGATPIAELSAIAVQSGEGFVSYVWPHPNTNNNEPKLAYAKLVKGWDLIVAAGIYTDDVEAAFWNVATMDLVTLVVIMAVIGGLAFAIERSTTARCAASPKHFRTLQMVIHRSKAMPQIARTRLVILPAHSKYSARTGKKPTVCKKNRKPQTPHNWHAPSRLMPALRSLNRTLKVT